MFAAPSKSFIGTLAFLSLALPASIFGQGKVVGTVPLPSSPPAAVMAKRYEIVSKGGVLSTVPPVAVVWLEGNFPAPQEPPPQAQIAQKNFVFEPALLPIRVGTVVAFPNLDSEYHNVFSYSKPKRFDLGRYLPGETPVPTETFDEPGSVVLRCDIHEHMKAIIIVVDSPRFITTDTAGHFELDDVPPGTYTVKAWVNSKTTLQASTTLSADQTSATVEF